MSQTFEQKMEYLKMRLFHFAYKYLHFLLITAALTIGACIYGFYEYSKMKNMNQENAKLIVSFLNTRDEQYLDNILSKPNFLSLSPYHKLALILKAISVDDPKVMSVVLKKYGYLKILHVLQAVKANRKISKQFDTKQFDKYSTPAYNSPALAEVAFMKTSVITKENMRNPRVVLAAIGMEQSCMEQSCMEQSLSNTALK